MIFELLSCLLLGSSLALSTNVYPVSQSVPLSPSISAEMAKTNLPCKLTGDHIISSNNQETSTYCYLVYSPNQALVDQSADGLFSSEGGISPFYLIGGTYFESTFASDYKEWLKIKYYSKLEQDKETLEYTQVFQWSVDSVSSTSNSSWNIALVNSRTYSSNVFAYYNRGSYFLNDYSLLFGRTASIGSTSPSHIGTSIYFIVTYSKYAVSNNIAYQQGYSKGKDEGYQTGKKDGYGIGFQEGKLAAASDNFANNALIDLFDSILSAPVKIIQNSLNFELFGVNFASLAFGVITIAMIVFVISFFIGKGKS